MEAAVYETLKTFVIHITASKAVVSIITLYPKKRLLLVALKQNTVPTKVLIKYNNFADVFSNKLEMKLSDYTRINMYAIKLFGGKSVFHNQIYSLRLVE